MNLSLTKYKVHQHLMRQVTASALSPAVFLLRQVASWMRVVAAWLLQLVISVVDCVQTAASSLALQHLYETDAGWSAVTAEMWFGSISCAWTA